VSVSLTSANRDRIALYVLGQQYSALSTPQKTLIDEAGTVPNTSPGGIAGEALRVVNDWSQWFTDTGAPNTTPDNWDHWFVAEASRRLALSQRPDRLPQFIADVKTARDAAFRSYTEAAINSATNNDGTFTLKDLRLYVGQNMSRQVPEPIMVPVFLIDKEAGDVIRWLWQRSNWNFRRRMTTATISTASVVTWTLTSPEAFDSIASLKLWYTDTNGMFCAWGNADVVAARLADTTATTGRPGLFRMQKDVSGVTWKFAPTPDQEYEVRGEIFIACPAIPANATATAPFSAFPSDFNYIIRDLILARVKMGFPQTAADGQKLWARAMDQVEQLAPSYDGRGTPEAQQFVALGDADLLSLSGNLGYGGNGYFGGGM
jgi:hypothetical protein